MNKVFFLAILILIVSASMVLASQDDNIEVVVLGMTNHGPMQPTINAIKEVTSKYPDVNLIILDFESQEGQNYAQEHGLSAHLNIIINGKYQYNINGKEITFQWFEGQQWTKDDLDAVISNILSDSGGITPVDNPKGGDGKNVFIVWTGIFAVIGAIAWFLIKKFKK